MYPMNCLIPDQHAAASTQRTFGQACDNIQKKPLPASVKLRKDRRPKIPSADQNLCLVE